MPGARPDQGKNPPDARPILRRITRAELKAAPSWMEQIAAQWAAKERRA